MLSLCLLYPFLEIIGSTTVKNTLKYLIRRIFSEWLLKVNHIEFSDIRLCSKFKNKIRYKWKKVPYKAFVILKTSLSTWLIPAKMCIRIEADLSVSNCLQNMSFFTVSNFYCFIYWAINNRLDWDKQKTFIWTHTQVSKINNSNKKNFFSFNINLQYEFRFKFRYITLLANVR